MLRIVINNVGLVYHEAIPILYLCHFYVSVSRQLTDKELEKSSLLLCFA